MNTCESRLSHLPKVICTISRWLLLRFHAEIRIFCWESSCWFSPGKVEIIVLCWHTVSSPFQLLLLVSFFGVCSHICKSGSLWPRSISMWVCLRTFKQPRIILSCSSQKCTNQFCIFLLKIDGTTKKINNFAKFYFYSTFFSIILLLFLYSPTLNTGSTLTSFFATEVLSSEDTWLWSACA